LVTSSATILLLQTDYYQSYQHTKHRPELQTTATRYMFPRNHGSVFQGTCSAVGPPASLAKDPLAPTELDASGLQGKGEDEVDGSVCVYIL